MPNQHAAHTALVAEVHKYVGGRANPDVASYTNPTGFDPRANRAYGLLPGSGDIINIQRVLIRPEHVGMIIGVFHNMEVKTGNADRKQHQIWFHETIESFGGVSGVVRSLEDADRLLNIWR